MEALIKASKYVVEGDTSENEETKLFVEQDIACRNPKCTNNGMIIKTIKSPIKIG